MALQLIKINEFPDSGPLSDTDFLAIGLPDGTGAKIDIASARAFIGVSVVRGIAETSTDPSPAATGDTWFAGPGTFTNFLDDTATPITTTEGLNALTYNGTSWDLLPIPIGVDLSDYTLNSDFDPVEAKTNALYAFVEQINVNPELGYIDSAGNFVANAAYVSTNFIDVSQASEFRYSGICGADAMPIVGYDSSQVFVSVLLSDGNYTDEIVSKPANISFVKFSARIQVGDTHAFELNTFYFDGQIRKNTSDIDKLNNLFQLVDMVNKATNPGFISDTTGDFVANAAYLSTGNIAVSQGDTVIYRGIVGSLVSPIAGYDVGGNFIFNPLISSDPVNEFPTDQIITIPEDVVNIKVSFRDNPGDYRKLEVTQLSIDISGLQPPEIHNFMPDFVYGKTGEMLRLYPNGILAKQNQDVRWTIEGGNQSFWEIETPLIADNGKIVGLKVYDLFGNDESLGDCEVRLVDTPISPASPLVALCIGDSLTQGSGASVDAAWVNEFSRRMTGVGTAIGDIQPIALSLTNVQFIGTRGNQPVKAEGRGGWSANDYLTKANLGAVTNAFWDGSQFNMDFYLTNNGFYSPTLPNGVVAGGGNLVVYILLGWNDIRLRGPELFETDLSLMVDTITSDLPNVDIKLLGLAAPPDNVYRTDKIEWSPEKIMRDFTIKQSEACSNIASTRANVEFLPVAPFFTPPGSFPVSVNNVSRRVSGTIDIVGDNVHPNDNGYAQIADVAYYNFLYNYCQ